MSNSSVYNIIQKFVDLIFPPSDRTRRIRSTEVEDLRKITKARQPSQDHISAVCDYRDELVRDVVYACKFAGTRAADELIGQCMQPELLAICQEERIFTNDVIITPVPLSRKRRQKRGFNQSARICKAIVKADEGRTFRQEQLLEKVRTTADQTELSKTERRKNVAQAFASQKKDIDAEAIFVIDDVVTTGATLTEARRALREVTDVKVIGIAFAH